MIRLLNDAALAFMLSIGHRSGLFDTLLNLEDWSTCEEIARAAKLDERYVRERLGALVTGRIIDLDPAGERYRLPAEHAAWLTRQATPNNLAGITQFMSRFGKVEDEVLECFRHGGGVPSEQFDRFHEVMAEDSAQSIVSALDQHILLLAAGLTDSHAAGVQSADVGCGRGLALMHLAARFPDTQFSGFDLAEAAIAWAKAEAQRRGSDNLRFEVRDAAQLGEQQRLDVLFAFDSIHDQIDPRGMLASMQKALKDDGLLLAQDIRASSHLQRKLDHPVAPLLYSISMVHCTTVSLAHNGCGLGTCCGEELALAMLNEAGFQHVEVHTLEHDIMNNYYVCRKR
jgi:2-polyprenyl-3-methyl-5-hydroxy-6-metoxy-1,4-benzoquinol methylase